MRIISPFRDYYDSVQRTGQDLTMVYVRNPVEVHYNGDNQEIYPFPALTNNYRIVGNDSRVDIKNYMVGFCGIIYPVLYVYHGSQDTDPHAYCYNVKDFDDFVTKNCEEVEIEHYHIKKKDRWKFKIVKFPFNLRREAVVEFFNKLDKQKDKFKHLFEKYQCPVFLGNCNPPWHHKAQALVTYNGSLRDVEFFRIMEPYTAFQEISMWIGNQAEPRKKIPEITDETMLQIKGFDAKTSFRKPSSKDKKA